MSLSFHTERRGSEYKDPWRGSMETEIQAELTTVGREKTNIY